MSKKRFNIPCFSFPKKGTKKTILAYLLNWCPGVQVSWEICTQFFHLLN